MLLGSILIRCEIKYNQTGIHLMAYKYVLIWETSSFKLQNIINPLLFSLFPICAWFGRYLSHECGCAWSENYVWKHITEPPIHKGGKFIEIICWEG